MFHRFVILLVIALFPAAAGLQAAINSTETRVAQSPGADSKSVWDGVYSDSQATSGLAVYTQYCATCHGPTLVGGANQGAPPLAGEKFMENWREDSLESLYTKIRSTMPRRSDKVLTETETLDTVSYLLRENGFPVATNPLNTTTLASIQIQLKDGPKPLPNNSLVNVVGCLTQQSGNWVLRTAGQPTRVRSTEATTPEELKAAESRALGDRTFRLENLYMLGNFDGEPHKGHKMLAKGVLGKRTTGEQISVTELEMVSAQCGQ